MALLTTPSQLPCPPRFVVFEGVNGAGKSTLQRSLRDRLIAEGEEVVMTFEPGATPLGAKLRELLLGSAAPARDALTELLLFTADRAEHVRSLIRPALARNARVLCDRYFYSTLAFQGYGRGVDRGLIEQLTSIAVGDTIPDLVILLNLDPVEGLKRTKGRSGSDSFEREALAFHERLHSGFLTMAKERPERFLIIDATQSPQQVLATALAYLAPGPKEAP